LDVFDVLIGGEDLHNLKPDPEGLLIAVERLSVKEAIYVGDTVIDAEAARRANLPFVAVLTGVTGRSEFDTYSTVAVLDDLSSLGLGLPGIDLIRHDARTESGKDGSRPGL